MLAAFMCLRMLKICLVKSAEDCAAVECDEGGTADM